MKYKTLLMLVVVALAVLFLSAGMCSDDDEKKKVQPNLGNISDDLDPANGTNSSGGNSTGAPGVSLDADSCNATGGISDVEISLAKNNISANMSDYRYAYSIAACDAGTADIYFLDSANAVTPQENFPIAQYEVIANNGSLGTTEIYAQICLNLTTTASSSVECATV